MCKLEVLESHVFFLQYHGKGYAANEVWDMDLPTLFRASKRLKDQLDAEHKAAKAHADAQRARRR